MYSTTFTFLSLTIASLSFAQTTTVDLFIPGADTQPLAASIVGSDATATTYAVQCIPGTDGSDCGFRGVFILTEGPERAAYTFAPELDGAGNVLFEGYFDCSLAGTTSAVCTASMGGSEANFPGIETETMTGGLPWMPVIITAGTASSTGTKVAVTTTSSTSSEQSTSTEISTGTKVAVTTLSATSSEQSTSTEISTGSGSAGSTVPQETVTSTSTGGVPAVTGGTKWGLAGMAAAAMLMA